MRQIDADEVHARLPYGALIPALAAAHRAQIDTRQSVVLDQPSAGGGQDSFLALPAWQRSRAMGAKLVTVFPENETNGSGLPSVQAVYVLFDGRDGRPLAIVDGTALTLRKTAADSGMGAHFLAPQGARTLLMVGAGAMAPHLIRAHLAARPSIDHVAIWNRTAARAGRLAATMDLPGVVVRAVDDLEFARQADVISCATMATGPLIRGAWLKPGTHLDLVGSFRPDMVECDGAALARGEVFVDSRWSAVEDCGEIVRALADGTLAESDILADAFQLARGEHSGRTSDQSITVYKNGGGGHLDLMVAQILTAPAGA